MPLEDNAPGAEVPTIRLPSAVRQPRAGAGGALAGCGSVATCRSLHRPIAILGSVRARALLAFVGLLAAGCAVSASAAGERSGAHASRLALLRLASFRSPTYLTAP